MGLGRIQIYVASLEERTKPYILRDNIIVYILLLLFSTYAEFTGYTGQAD